MWAVRSWSSRIPFVRQRTKRPTTGPPRLATRTRLPQIRSAEVLHDGRRAPRPAVAVIGLPRRHGAVPDGHVRRDRGAAHELAVGDVELLARGLALVRVDPEDRVVHGDLEASSRVASPGPLEEHAVTGDRALVHPDLVAKPGQHVADLHGPVPAVGR